MENKMTEDFLAKWLNNELTEAELTEFKNSDGYATYVRIARASKDMNPPHFNHDRAFEAIKNRREFKSGKVVSLFPYKKFMKVAAAIILLLSASYFYLNSLGENINTPYAQNKEIVLPDASEVILNADSRLSYSKKDWSSERSLTLEGEAYFRVAKGKKFTVSTALGDVTVLGTQFNVTQRNGLFEVDCYEGRVQVTFMGKETQLSAGTSFLAINGVIMSNRVVKTEKPSWVNKESSFEAIPLRYVLAEFERQHNIQVKSNDLDLDQVFTGTFSNTNPELALKSICTPSQIKFKLEGNKVQLHAENAP
ncbi:MAG: FecR family protein [Flavobacteriaceae bacterium]